RRWPSVLRSEPRRSGSPCRELCRSHLERGAPGGPSDPTTREVGTRHQHEDCEDPGPHDPPIPAATRRSRLRMTHKGCDLDHEMRGWLRISQICAGLVAKHTGWRAEGRVVAGFA